jgi:hypothetical protein
VHNEPVLCLISPSGRSPVTDMLHSRLAEHAGHHIFFLSSARLMLLICKRRLSPADPDSICKACTAAASQASACARLRRRSDKHEANRIFRVSRQRRAGRLGILLVTVLVALSFPTTQAITIYPGTDVVQVRHLGTGSIGNVLVPLYTEGHPLVTNMGLLFQ